MTQATPLVDFVIAGVQKCGTTALHALLSQHSSIRFADIKEVHFFDCENIDWSNPDYNAYHEHFAVSNDVIYGDATPIYIYWPNGLERIRVYRPNMKFVLLFRDPAERAWSHWRMEHSRMYDLSSFDWAIRDGRKRFAQAGYHRIFSYVERGFYGFQVKRLLTLFPQDQILFLSSSDLLNNCEVALSRICKFLGIKPFSMVPSSILYNVSSDKSRMREVDESYLRRLFQEDTEIFSSLTGIYF